MGGRGQLMICLLFKICFVALSGPNIQKYKVDSQNTKDYHVGNGQNLYKLYKTNFAALTSNATVQNVSQN